MYRFARVPPERARRANYDLMRKHLSRTLAAAGLLLLIAACTSVKRPAPVVDRAPPQSQAADNTRQRSAAAQSAPRGFYTVKRGDTLHRIAQEFGQNWRDLVAWNNLSAPNDIKVDQVLRVLPPDSAPAAQTSAVASRGVEVRPIAPARSGPRGDKRPYSDTALTEMQKPDSQSGAVRSDARPVEQPEKSAEQATTAEDVLNLIWPTEGRVIATFDPNRKGIDIAGTLGQPVLAAGAGSVLYAGSMRGYGNLVIVKHTNTYLSAYAHNKTILVKEGQTVSRGQKIAEMGNSDTDSVKLHFEIRQQGKPVDPTKYLPSR